MKKSIIVLLALLLIVSAVSVAFAEDEKPLFIAINKSADQNYFIDLQGAFVKNAEELGAEAKTFDAKLDPSLGVSLVDNAISSGAAGIAITVPDQTIGPAISKAARDAGVVLIATDDSIVDENGDPVPFVGFDGTEMGTKAGVAAAELLEENGWLKDPEKKVGALIANAETVSVIVQRCDAEKAELVKAGMAEDMIFTVPYTGETLSAQDAAGPIITANPDVTNWVVTGGNDEGVLGILNALATAGVSTEDILGIGVGGNESCKPWAAKIDSGFKACVWVSGISVGTKAAEVLYDAVANGVTPPQFSIADTFMLTPENFQEIMDPVSLANCGL